MQRFLHALLFLCIAASHLSVMAQTKLNGAFAGSDFVPNVSGMMRYDYSYYLRPDGSFASSLDKTDWKTRIDGYYTVNGKSVKLTYKSGSSDSYTLMDGGYLFSGTTNLFKYEPGNLNQVPAHTFEYTSASSMGGVGTGMPYSGGYGKNFLALDGKGNFSHSSFGSGSVVSPDFSHGSFKESKGDGTYTLKDGLLTLTYADGKVVTKSFFYSGGKSASALINGSVYWVMKGDDSKTTDPKTKTPAEGKEQKADGLLILKNASLVHGGKKLDEMKSARLEAQIGDVDVVMLLDFPRKFIRYEYFQKGQLLAVEQSENNSGWQWSKGKTAAITAARNAELQNSFSSGILALRSAVLQKINIQSAEQKEGGMQTVYFELNNKKQAYIFDKNNRLAGEVVVSGQEQQSTLSSDFKMVDGILVPFTVKDKRGGTETVIRYKTVRINPFFSDTDWQKKE